MLPIAMIMRRRRRRINWTPAQIPTALWLDANDTSTITLNNLTVSQWNDKSGNLRHVSQATAANQPVYAKGQNLFTYSEQLNQTAWQKVASTISADVITAPDGTLTADKVEETATTNFHMLRGPTWTFANNTQYTISGYFKAGERTLIQLAALVGGVGGSDIYLNLATGTLSNQGGIGWITNGSSVESVGNGWYRASLTFTTTTGGSGFIDYRLAPSVGTLSYAGTAGFGAYMWGIQVNTGPLQPYQKTEATAVNVAAVNGLPNIVFDGTNDFLRSTVNIGISGTQTFSLFAVHTFPWVLLKVATSFGGVTRYHHMSSTTSNQYWTGYDAGTQIGTYTPSNPSTAYMLGIERTGNTGASWNVYQNGTALSVTAGNNNAVNLDNGPISVGSYIDGTLSTAMNYNELIITNTQLSVAERQAIEGYLAWKWGGF